MAARSLLLEDFVVATCDPVFATYVGKALDDSPDLSIGSTSLKGSAAR
jgi:hypothetical protein